MLLFMRQLTRWKMRFVVGDNNERSDGDVVGDKLAEERTVVWMMILKF